MAQIEVKVADKDYTLACAEGDETRLADLANYVDAKARDLRSKLGHIAENRLLLMVAILIADELKEHRETGGLSGPLSGFSGDDMAEILNQVSMEVEGIAEQLAKP